MNMELVEVVDIMVLIFGTKNEGNLRMRQRNDSHCRVHLSCSPGKRCFRKGNEGRELCSGAETCGQVQIRERLHSVQRIACRHLPGKCRTPAFGQDCGVLQKTSLF